MIELAMEIPRALLKDISPLCDFEFCLAQETDNEEYAKFYKEAVEKIGRTCIMDNGFHELGRPLSVLERFAAANKVNPTYVIAPDMLADLKWTFEEWKKCKHVFRDSKVKVIPVLVDAPELDQKSFILNIDGDVLCLPFRRPRLNWYRFHREEIRKKFQHIHLLGINTLEELEAFSQLGYEDGIRLTVDTSKPVKWGLLKQRLISLDSVRGAPIHSSSLIGVENVSQEQLGTISWNIAYLRRFLG